MKVEHAIFRTETRRRVRRSADLKTSFLRMASWTSSFARASMRTSFFVHKFSYEQDLDLTFFVPLTSFVCKDRVYDTPRS